MHAQAEGLLQLRRLHRGLLPDGRQMHFVTIYNCKTIRDEYAQHPPSIAALERMSDMNLAKSNPCAYRRASISACNVIDSTFVQ